MPDDCSRFLWNVLHNAIKFTPKGGCVSVGVEERNGHVNVVIQDTGRGISGDFLPHVFERFRQEDSSTTRESPGLGLGLSIVKHLVELHGGTIRAFSGGPDTGATFTVELLAGGVPTTATAPAGVSEQLVRGRGQAPPEQIRPDRPISTALWRL